MIILNYYALTGHIVSLEITFDTRVPAHDIVASKVVIIWIFMGTLHL